MSGSREGQLRGARTRRIKYGEDHFRKQCQKAGRTPTTGGFKDKKVGKDGLTGRERASIAGRKGGTMTQKLRYKSNFEKIIIKTTRGEL